MLRDFSIKQLGIMAVLVCYHLTASTIGLVVIKKALQGVSFSFQMLLDPRILIGGALYFTSALTWFFILARFPLSFIYPLLSGLSYMLVTIASILVLKEKPDPVTITGIVLILAGIMTITLKGRTI